MWLYRKKFTQSSANHQIQVRVMRMFPGYELLAINSRCIKPLVYSAPCRTTNFFPGWTGQWFSFGLTKVSWPRADAEWMYNLLQSEEAFGKWIETETLRPTLVLWWITMPLLPAQSSALVRRSLRLREKRRPGWTRRRVRRRWRRGRGRRKRKNKKKMNMKTNKNNKKLDCLLLI